MNNVARVATEKSNLRYILSNSDKVHSFKGVEEYSNQRSKITVTCREGHTHLYPSQNILRKRKSWTCYECDFLDGKMQNLPNRLRRNLAVNNLEDLLSKDPNIESFSGLDSYKNQSSQIIIVCKQGHKTTRRAADLMKDIETKCADCAFRTPESQFKRMQQALANLDCVLVGPFNGPNKNTKIRCKICGWNGDRNYYHAIIDGKGCDLCQDNRTSEVVQKKFIEFIKYYQKEFDCKHIGDNGKTGNKLKLKFSCNRCGGEFFSIIFER